MLGFIKEKLKKVYNQFTTKAANLFSRHTIDQDFLQELEILLISADTGISTTRNIISSLTTQIKKHIITQPQNVRVALKEELLSLLQKYIPQNVLPEILILVGVNGSGKTTFASKFAHILKQQGRKVLLVAGDTFRAAATEQLVEWGKKIDVNVFVGKEHQDPASVIFDACTIFKQENYDHIIIDTAGRLQTKINLMKELEKIKKIIARQLPNQSINAWLTIDAMLGQNSFEQAKIFNEAINLNGIILTKLDGTGKGGIVFAITNELHLPIIYVTFGENIDALKLFDSKEYINNLLEK